MSNVRTRMAPSPTGEYHIGHIRTVLYNIGLSKQKNGKFIIRIEDTDRQRYVEGAVERILDVISDYGLSWDEGPRVGGDFGPYVQSERLDTYKKYALELVEKKAAYYCFCTPERLEKMREEQKARKVPSTKYDRHCLNLSKKEIEKNLNEEVPYVIRLKIPDNRVISFEDAVFGKISIHSSEIDDQVLLKSDGYPTYQLAVVVDDHLMEISHVMRGNDWIPSTPKHVLLYEAFGWEMPVHIHLPNLKELGANKKLSKRFGPVSAREFLDDGYLPEALLNFLMFLGWNPGGEKEIYSLDEFIKDFDIKKIHKTDLVAFDRKKLDWFNSQYIQKLTDEEFVKRARPFVSKELSDERLFEIAPLVKSRIKKFSELDGFIEYFHKEKTPVFSTDKYQEHISAAIKALESISSNWSLPTINERLSQTIEENKFKTGEFYLDLRSTIAGSSVTPPINESMQILGSSTTIARLENGLELYTKDNK